MMARIDCLIYELIQYATLESISRILYIRYIHGKVIQVAHRLFIDRYLIILIEYDKLIIVELTES